MKKPFIEFKYRHEFKNTLKGAFVMYDFRLEQFKREMIRLFNSKEFKIAFWIMMLIFGITGLILEFI
jgi:hypothetical protein